MAIIIFFDLFRVDGREIEEFELDCAFLVQNLLFLPVVVADETEPNHKDWSDVEVNHFVNELEDSEGCSL